MCGRWPRRYQYPRMTRLECACCSSAGVSRNPVELPQSRGRRRIFEDGHHVPHRTRQVDGPHLEPDHRGDLGTRTGQLLQQTVAHRPVTHRHQDETLSLLPGTACPANSSPWISGPPTPGRRYRPSLYPSTQANLTLTSLFRIDLGSGFPGQYLEFCACLVCQ